jgi:hypothetical protein
MSCSMQASSGIADLDAVLGCGILRNPSYANRRFGVLAGLPATTS